MAIYSPAASNIHTFHHREFGAHDTTGKPVFAVRQNLCRAFYFGRTAKSLFAVRFLYSAR
jgi:hypothetical protein